MTILYVNTGTSANRGDGDSLRVAFTKINQNFAEISGFVNTSTAGVVVGTTPPGDPAEGKLWYDDVAGRLYVYYDNTWVDASPALGETGAQGPQGDIGAQGAQGDIGPVAYQQGSPFGFSTLSAYNPNDIVSYGGTFWILSDYSNYVQSFTPDTYIGWSPFYLTGPQGAQGNDGAQGAQGNDGAQGAQGNDGAQGPQGNDGAQGAQGNDGAQGPQGETVLPGGIDTQVQFNDNGTLAGHPNFTFNTTTDTLQVPDNIVVNNVFSVDNTVVHVHDDLETFGDFTAQGIYLKDGGSFINLGNGIVDINTTGTLRLEADGQSWTFSTTGTLTTPGSIIPDADSQYDLGSSTNQWRHIYVSTGSIYLGNVKLTSENNQFSVQQLGTGRSWNNFMAIYGDLAYDQYSQTGVSVAYDSEGSLYVVGNVDYNYTGTNYQDTLALKYNGQGDFVWDRTWRDLTGGEVPCAANDSIIIRNINGEDKFYFMANQNALNQGGFWIGTMDLNGVITSSTVYGFFQSIGRDMDVDATGNIYVATFAGNQASPYPMPAVFKFDANHQLLWTSLLDIGYNNGFFLSNSAIGVVPDTTSSVYVINQRYDDAISSTHAHLMKLDAATGDIMWQQDLVTAAGDIPWSVYYNPTNDTVLTAHTDPQESQSVVGCYANDGSPLWRTSFLYSWPQGTEVRDISVSADGFVWVTGISYIDYDNTNYDLFWAKLDPTTGNLLAYNMAGSNAEEANWGNGPFIWGHRMGSVYGTGNDTTIALAGITYANTGSGTYGTNNVFTVQAKANLVEEISVGQFRLRPMTATAMTMTVTTSSFSVNPTVYARTTTELGNYTSALAPTTVDIDFTLTNWTQVLATGNVGIGVINTFTFSTGGEINVPAGIRFPDGSLQTSANVAGVTADSTTTFTNKTWNIVPFGGNDFQIQGNSIYSYSGSGPTLALTETPTFHGLNLYDSGITADGGTGGYFWTAGSNDGEGPINKAGVFRTTSTSSNALFTFGANGPGTMSVQLDGSLFIGATPPNNATGLTTDYGGWLVVTGGAKLGGDIDTLGDIALSDADGELRFANQGSIGQSGNNINFTARNGFVTVSTWTFATTGEIVFPDQTVQTTAYQLVDPPATLQGAAGDKQNMVAYDNDYYYYCKQDFVNTSTYSIQSNYQPPFPLSYILLNEFNSGWVSAATDFTGYTVTGPNGYVGTVTGPSTNTQFQEWQIPVSPDCQQQLSGWYTFTSPSGDIWVRSAWGASIGSQGPQGDIGAQGAQGDSGPQGPQGDNGAQGYQGDSGPQGYQGDVGPSGTNGTSVNIAGSTSTQASLPYPYGGSTGDGFITQDDGHLWVYGSGTWTDVGSIVGPVGPQGPQGVNGAQGAQGDMGPQGYQGDNGAQGYQGDMGPQGYQGDNGAQGYQGDMGPQGYQGDNGAQGAQGDNGAQGYQGDMGPQGYQGDNGAQGAQGYQGDIGPVAGTDKQIIFNDNSFAGASSNFTFDKTTKVLTVTGNIVAYGNTGTGISALDVGVANTELPNTVASFSSNVNNYTQVTVQNLNSGTDATSDFILTANNGSDTTNYLDLGIINSGYDSNTPTNSLGNIISAGDSYLYAQGNAGNINQSGGNLAIGTTVQGKIVKIFAGGINSGSVVINISSGSVAVTGNLIVSGDVNANSGYFKTTATTAYVVNSTATQVFIAGGATAGTTIGNSAGTVTINGNLQASTNGFAIGYRDIPQLSLTTNTTLAATDGGKHYYSTLGSTATITIPASTTTNFAIGTAVNVVNQGTANININTATGVTLYLAGNSTPGNRVLASYGIATVQKVAADTWFVVGVGLT